MNGLLGALGQSYNPYANAVDAQYADLQRQSYEQAVGQQKAAPKAPPADNPLLLLLENPDA